MKCQSCNAHLSIEDENCRYCGAPNPEAIKHRQDMKKFSGDYARTKFSVLKTTSERAQKSTRIVIVCVMFLITSFSFLFYAISGDLAYEIVKFQASTNSEKYCALLDQYEEEEDYLSFVALYNQKSLYGVDKFDQYRYVYDAASYYQYIFSDISMLLEEERLGYTYEDILDSLLRNLDFYYSTIERKTDDYYSHLDAYQEQHLNAVERITEKIDGLLQLTFSISEEEMVNFKDYSPAEKQVFIERRFKENVNNI